MNNLEKEALDDDRKFAVGSALGFMDMTIASGDRFDEGRFITLVETIYNFLEKTKTDGK
jgi:hypothetical protein